MTLLEAEARPLRVQRSSLTLEFGLDQTAIGEFIELYDHH